MLSPRDRRLPLAALIAALAGCRSPTQVTVDLSTDEPCAKTLGTAIFFGGAAVAGDASSGPITDACNPTDGAIGSIVIVPGGASDGRFEIKAVLGVGFLPEDCLADPTLKGPDKGCIFASRSLNFVPHTPIELPIVLRADCLGIACPEGKTCRAAECVPNTITNPTACAVVGACGDHSFGTGGAGGAPTGSTSSTTTTTTSTTGTGGAGGAMVDAGRTDAGDDAGDAGDGGPVNAVDGGPPTSGQCATAADCPQGGKCLVLAPSGYRVCAQNPVPASCSNAASVTDCACPNAPACQKGICHQEPACGSVPIHDICDSDECTTMGDSCTMLDPPNGPGICLPRGVGGVQFQRCVPAECTSDDFCVNGPGGKPGGRCELLPQQACCTLSLGLFCTYPVHPDDCQTSADCPATDGGVPECSRPPPPVQPNPGATVCGTCP